MPGRIVSVNVAKPQTVKYQNQDVETSIFKQPVNHPLRLARHNFEGDAQADLINHGGADKAVCVYPHEHYSFWERNWGRPLEYGAFGENVTTEGFSEEQVCIGDIFRVGSATVQVSQPRQPCFKLGLRHGLADLPAVVLQTGYTGYYYRVLEEGEVGPGDVMRLVSRDPAGVTVAEANRVKHIDKTDVAALRRLVTLQPLADSWKQSFRQRLAELGEA